MSQSLVKNLLHLVWSTKNRQQFISEGIRGDLEKYIGGIFRNLNTTPIQIGAAPDHIHCLIDLTKNTALKEVLEKVKSSSSKWMKERGTKYQNFYWQNGYAGFSISASHKDAVIERPFRACASINPFSPGYTRGCLLLPLRGGKTRTTIFNVE